MGKRKGESSAVPSATAALREADEFDTGGALLGEGEPTSPYDSGLEDDDSEEGSEMPSIDDGEGSEEDEGGGESGESEDAEGASDDETDGSESGEDEQEGGRSDDGDVASGDESDGAISGEGEEGGSGALSDDELDDAILDLAAPQRVRRAGRGGLPSAGEQGPGDAGEPWDSAGEEGEEGGEDGAEDGDLSEEEADPADDLRAALEADPGSDSSEDERPQRNTVGRVPLEWYKDEDHIGYDKEGQKLFRKGRKRDKLDALLARNDSAKDWRTIYDEYNDEEITLSKEELQLIQRIRQGRFPDVEINPYEPEVDFFTREPMLHPLHNAPEPKRRFMPSKWEEKKVVKLVRALRKGWLKIRKDDEDEEAKEPPVYLLWADDGRVADKTASGLTYIPPPKPPLPGHEESYNPPKEYIPTDEERAAALSMHPEDRPAYLPIGFPSLRQVPMYADFIKERFERCLDLYLCPRARRKRPFITDAKSLVPKLPKPSDLQPFPSHLLLRYEGHTGPVRCIQPDPTGQWLASGSNDGTLRVWEVRTGRCLRTWSLGERVLSVAWCPNQALELLAASCGNKTLLLCPGLGSEETEAATGQALDVAAKAAALGGAAGVLCRWTRLPDRSGLELQHNHPVTWVTWHGRGDYFATVSPTGNTQAVLVHQLSRGASQNPFRKNRGRVVRVMFHPTKPFFFVATENGVRCYNLAKQELAKKLVGGSGSITCMAVHSSGDHIITGSEDTRLAWYDMDYSTKPYKVLRYHKHCLNGVAFHRSYPLFASASDDSIVRVFHGMVYQDLMTNPLMVPLTSLRGHSSKGVEDIAFHPSQPWLFTAGEDAAICLFTN